MCNFLISSTEYGFVDCHCHISAREVEEDLDDVIQRTTETFGRNRSLVFPSGISRALLHNFAGKPPAALEGVTAGYLFSFPPAVGRNQQRDEVIKQIPLEHICQRPTRQACEERAP
ncbi:putative deoxyribonuclease tatdn3 [Lycodopsis pacificus]